MNKIFHFVRGLSLLALLALINAGCPVGIAYPMCEKAQVEKLDKRLIGTWKSLSDEAEILSVKITAEDDLTFGVEVLEQGENYMADDTRFYSWTTKLDGYSFIFSQPIDAENQDYFTYEYRFEGPKLVIHDVSLLVGGMDAVTSIETFRQEVSASLKNPDCLTSRIEYLKE